MFWLLARFNKRVGRNATVKLVSELLARAASFGLILLAARQLGEADFGRYNYALALGFVLSQVADLGIQVVLAREVARRGMAARGLVAVALRLKLLLSLPLLLLFTLLALSSDSALRLPLFILGMMMLAQTYLEFVAYIFRGEQVLEVEALLLAGARLLVAALGAGVLLGGGGLVALAATNLLGVLSVTVFAFRLLVRRGWLRGPAPAHAIPTAADQLPWLVREALPLGLAIFMSIAYTRLAVLLLQHLQGEVAVATFSAAQRLVEPSQIVPASILAAVFPAFSLALEQRPAAARRLGWSVAIFLSLVGAVVATAFFLLAPVLVRVLYGPSFVEAAPVLRWLGLSTVPAFLNYALTHYLIARGQQRLIGLFTLVMLILHGALSLFWIPRWGPLGPALSIIIAESILFVLCLLALAVSQPAARPPGSLLEQKINDYSSEPAPTAL